MKKKGRRTRSQAASHKTKNTGVKSGGRQALAASRRFTLTGQTLLQADVHPHLQVFILKQQSLPQTSSSPKLFYCNSNLSF